MENAGRWVPRGDGSGSAHNAPSAVDHGLDDLPLGVLIIADGELIRVNEDWMALTGLDLAHSSGDQWLQAVHEEDRPLAARLLFGGGSGTAVDDVRLRHTSGGPDVWVHARSRLVGRDERTICVITLTEIGARKTREQRLLHRATHDPGTGLANAEEFRAVVDAALSPEHGGGPLAIFFIDLDRFKAINDTVGHAFGDLALSIVAQRLEGAVRPSDSVARIGGDEFAIMFRGGSRRADAAHLAERVINAISAPCMIGGHEVTVGASVGIAMSSPELSADSLLARADRAMYQAKATGGCQWVFAEDTDLTGLTDAPRLRQAHPNANDAAAETEALHQAYVSLTESKRAVLALLTRYGTANTATLELVRSAFEQLWTVVDTARSVPFDAPETTEVPADATNVNGRGTIRARRTPPGLGRVDPG